MSRLKCDLFPLLETELSVFCGHVHEDWMKSLSALGDEKKLMQTIKNEGRETSSSRMNQICPTAHLCCEVRREEYGEVEEHTGCR